MMHLLPSAATNIFQGLCQLFEFFLCSIFKGFVSLVDQDAHLGVPSKMTSTSPYQARNFEALKSMLDRALSDAISFAKEVPAKDTRKNNANRRKSSDVVWESCTIASLTSSLEVVLRCDSKSFFALNARIVAAESCWFVAMTLQEVKQVLLNLIPENFHVICKEFTAKFQQEASQLRALVYRTACPLLINGKNILAQIVDAGGWDSRQMRPVDVWVKQIVSNCGDLWTYLFQEGEFGDATALVREQMWLELCQSAFDIALDGFSQVKRVSSDGRAQMLRDMEALQQGLDEIHPCNCPRGLSHVEAYVRAATQAPEEMMLWIQDNYNAYAYRHIHGLVVQTFSSMVFRSRLRDATEFIDELYGLSSCSPQQGFGMLFDTSDDRKGVNTKGIAGMFKMGF